jgi:hypothetical protein
MANVPRCPACQTPHHRSGAAAGALLFCDACGSVFEAADEPPEEAPPAHPEPHPEPRPQPPAPAGEGEGRGAHLLLTAVVMVLLNLMAAVGGGFFVVLDRINAARSESERRAERAEGEREGERAADAERRRT